MTRYKLSLVLFLLFLGALVAAYLIWGHLLSYDSVRENRDALRSYVQRNYVSSAVVFTAIFVTTGFFVPGALTMSLLGGFLFGTASSVIYVSIGHTIGATLAFMAARYFIGGWVQKKFKGHLESFNEEVERHGANYLLLLRVVPLLPSFLVNYLAGVTKISLAKFVLTTALGELPGAFICGYAGSKLATIKSSDELLSLSIVLPVAGIAAVILIPVVRSYWTRRRNKLKQHVHGRVKC